MFKVIVKREGVNDYTDESYLGVDEKYLLLEKFWYLWDGNSEIDYRTDNGLLFVNGELVGVNLTWHSDLDSLPRDKIVTVSIEKSHLETIESQFPQLNSVHILGAVWNQEFELLQHLHGIENLKLLWFNTSTLQDSALEYVADLKNLKVLGLANCGIADQGLQSLEKCSDLRVLNLVGMKGIEGWGLGRLSNLSNLKRLILSHTGITNDALKHLSLFTGLKELNLDNTNVDDGGVEYLEVLENLKLLELRGTAISEQKRKELEEALPECNIIWHNTDMSH